MFFRWVWNSGSAVNGSDALWAEGEPNNHGGDQDCGVFSEAYGYMLADLNCYNFCGGICQIPPE